MRASSTSSSEGLRGQRRFRTRRLAAALAYIGSGIRLAALSLAFLLVMGEVYMRLPFIPQRLEYRPDRDLGGVLRPDQVGYVWLGNMSFKSPPVTINRDGHRGRDTDWSRPVLLVLGDSESFGAGVEDDAVWTARLEQALRRRPPLAELQVVNASHPGHGPHHHVVFLRRVLRAHRVDGVLVRVAVGQRNFRVPPPAELEREISAAERRETIRKVTKFLPFLYNKVELQLPRIQTALVPAPIRKPPPAGPDSSPASGRRSWREGRAAWEEMVRVTACDDVPIAFVVQDPTERPATGALAAELASLTGDGRVHVLRLGPEAFGLDAHPGAESRRILRATLTLVRDPHANSQQHQLIADALAAGLEARGVTARLENRHARAGEPPAPAGGAGARRECIEAAEAGGRGHSPRSAEPFPPPRGS